MLYLERGNILEIRLSWKRCEEIKRIVVKMFQDYGVSCVPINGFEIAAKMGIKVIPYSAFPDVVRCLMIKKSEDGFSVELDSGEWRIYYNDAKDYGRVNNTIMHELGHIVLDHTEDSELAEKEVKFFAKYALAPPVLIHKFKLTDVYEVMRIFEISFEAAAYAYDYYQKWLEYGSCEYTDYELVTLNLFSLAV